MICNQAAILSMALLRHNKIPARIVDGLRGGLSLGGDGHMWVEYRDGSNWQSLDATPLELPSYSGLNKQSSNVVDNTLDHTVVRDMVKNTVDIQEKTLDELNEVCQSSMDNISMYGSDFYFGRNNVNEAFYKVQYNSAFLGQYFAEYMQQYQAKEKIMNTVDVQKHRLSLNHIKQFLRKTELWMEQYRVNVHFLLHPKDPRYSIFLNVNSDGKVNYGSQNPLSPNALKYHNWVDSIKDGKTYYSEPIALPNFKEFNVNEFQQNKPSQEAIDYVKKMVLSGK